METRQVFKALFDPVKRHLTNHLFVRKDDSLTFVGGATSTNATTIFTARKQKMKKISDILSCSCHIWRDPNFKISCTFIVYWLVHLFIWLCMRNIDLT